LGLSFNTEENKSKRLCCFAANYDVAGAIVRPDIGRLGF
jgi:hypothetical protein